MKGFLPWFGGKHLLAKAINRHIETIPHTCYVEPFAGAAHVFFRREPVRTEVLNDINRDLVTLYRVLKNHLDEFLRQFDWMLVSRDEFNRQLKMDPDTLTDIQRAARFYYLQKCRFGGMLDTKSFGTSTTGKPRLNMVAMREQLAEVQQRLAQVYVENLTWQNCLTRYDRPHTLFYIDPPYWGHEADYGKGIFGREDFADMAGILAGIQGNFILSLNDTPEVRATFAPFHMLEVQTNYTAGGKPGTSRKAQELLISNVALGMEKAG